MILCTIGRRYADMRRRLGLPMPASIFYGPARATFNAPFDMLVEMRDHALTVDGPVRPSARRSVKWLDAAIKAAQQQS